MKLLMLHGYTQNGDVFQRKLRRLTAKITHAFPGTTFHWPSGPLKLQVDDLPDLVPRQSTGIDDLDLRAWFDLRDTQDPPKGFLNSLDLLADVLDMHGPFDGIVAFSQGAVVAPFIASLLQGQARYEAFLVAKIVGSNVMAYPKSFKELQHPRLKFAVLCAGRLVQEKYYDWMYESPRLETPFCLFNGDLDPMVDYGDRAAVPERLSGRHLAKVVVHPGAHHMPNDERSLATIVQFMRDHVSAKSDSSDDSAWEFVGGSPGYGEERWHGRACRADDKGSQRVEGACPRCFTLYHFPSQCDALVGKRVEAL